LAQSFAPSDAIKLPAVFAPFIKMNVIERVTHLGDFVVFRQRLAAYVEPTKDECDFAVNFCNLRGNFAIYNNVKGKI